MKKLVLNIANSMDKKREEIRPPKCWICMDRGLVIYYKKENEIIYETAAKCTCIKGARVGAGISFIHHSLVEQIAKLNFEEFQKRHPEAIKKLNKVG